MRCRQVFQDGADEGAVGHHPGGPLDGEADMAAGVLALEFCRDAGGLGTEIDFPEGDLCPETMDRRNKSSMSCPIRSLAALIRSTQPRPISSRLSAYHRSGWRRSWLVRAAGRAGRGRPIGE